MTEIFQIPSALADSTYINSNEYERLYAYSISQPERFWEEQALTHLDWHTKWSRVLEWDYSKAHIRWFINGKLNVAYNCIDRHLEKRGNKIAIIWEGNEPGEVRRLTYNELQREVSKLANVLKARGIKKGDRIAIYMPMIPEVAVAMLACARIGAVHSVIFAGFSADSIRDRVQDCSAKMIITANEALRGSKKIPLKEIVDQAIDGVSTIEHVLVYNRTDSFCQMRAGRDLRWSDEIDKVSDYSPPEIMDSEDPLFILYTSGSTGKPKGVLHTQAGYLLYTTITHRYVFDYREDDIYFCAADAGWVTGHSYIVYGPLSNGATTMMFESIPTYPNAGRYWDVIERHKVNIFYTAPTAIRTVAKEGDHLVDKYDLSSLRILGSVGEPINRDAWLWYYNRIGKGRCSIVDTWWQTETGGILISPLPGATRLKPGSATRPFLGIQPCVVDENGKELEGDNVKGRLCIKFPWPGQMRTVFGDHQRFFDTYFREVPGKYFAGDACLRDGDGYYWVTGRVDDVLNVSGHRLGTAEIESAIAQSGIVIESAVVGMPHELKGIGIYAFCILKHGQEPNIESEKKIIESVRRVIGPIATPDTIQFVSGLPKTRSGKIMRRILRKIAAGERDDFGDTTTLAEPSVVEEIARAANVIKNPDSEITLS